MYRPDIDGLRAVAVVSVILYHFGYSPLPGGFIGVDIFFVISGFLITGLIFREIDAGTFSFAGFYERRARRILPALLIVIVSTIFAGYFVVLSSDYELLGWQAITSAFGLSNAYFALNSGYFDSATELSPLLHTWSLAVEEQFYLFWPVILALLYTQTRSKTVVVTFLGLLIFSSLAISIYATDRSPNIAFYMLHTRAWELGAGAILAFIPPLQGHKRSEAAGLAGLVLILGSLILISDKNPFPGVLAIPPCLGAALLIWPKQRSNTVSGLMSRKPVVFIGLISYSLYLWHWPVLVLFKHVEFGSSPNVLQGLALLAFILLISILSWKFVEQPFRRSNHGRKLVLSISVLSMIGVAVVGASAPRVRDLMDAANYPDTFEESNRIASYSDYLGTAAESAQFRSGVCYLTSNSDDFSRFDKELCVNTSSTLPNILLWGDSHAAHLWGGIASRFSNVNLMQATASGCIPALPLKGARRCTDLAEYVLSDVVFSDQIDGVVISARWKSRDLPGLQMLVDLLQKRDVPVLVLGPSVEYAGNFPDLLAVDILKGGDVVKQRRKRQQSVADKQFEKILSDGNVPYFSIFSALCNSNDCLTLTNDRTPVQFDHSHFTEQGAEYVAARLYEFCPGFTCLK